MTASRSGRFGRFAVAVAALLTGGCAGGGPAASGRSAEPAASPSSTVADLVRPTTVVPTTVVSTTVVSATVVSATVVSTTVVSTTVVSATVVSTTVGAAPGDEDAQPPAPARPQPVLESPAQRIVVLGDSLLANTAGLPNGRYNSVVDSVHDRLRANPLLADVEVVNRTRAGQAILVDSWVPSNPGENTLVNFVHTSFDGADPATLPDLAIIATSAIDVSSVPIETLDDVIPGVIAALTDLVAFLDDLGVDAVLLPAFPVNDELFDRGFDHPQRATERIRLFNEALRATDLPLLFEAFAGADADGIPGTDPALFAGFADPPDGVHLGPLGEAFYVDALVPPLERLLLSGWSGPNAAP